VIRDRDRLYAILLVVAVAAIVLVMVLWFGATQFGWIIGPHAD